jgi:hypothetical protein
MTRGEPPTRAGDLTAEAEAFAAGFSGRVPGSDAERRAARHLESRLRELGRQADLEPTDTWPNWPLAYVLHAGLGVAGSVVSVSAPVLGASLAFLAALLTFLDASAILPTTRRLLGRRASQNVVSWGDRDAPAALVIVAHHDAARSGLVLSERWERRRAALGTTIGRSIGPLELFFWALLCVLACCLLRLPGLSGTALTAIQLVPTAALIVAAALLIDIALSGPGPGENDNASGVALALALARRPLKHLGVHLVLPGAQKAMADGMRAFLRRHRGELDRTRTVVVNLDEVGAGAVRWSSREGPIVTLRSHPELTALCEAVAEDDEAAHARPIINRVPSDGYAARAAGLPAITITCRSEPGYAPSQVDTVALGRAEAFCGELLSRLDAELSQPDG